MTPWIFGDEYLYLSKARNIRLGIDVLADVSVGHTYPPLYSYLLSLVMGADPFLSYQRVQILNVLVFQVILFLAFYLLNRVYKWSRSKIGILLAVLTYIVLATQPIAVGFQLVAMSENLFTPLVVLILAIFTHLHKNNTLQNNLSRQTLWFGVLGILTASAILTRSIGVVLIPVVVFSWLSKFVNPNLKNWNHKQFWPLIAYLITTIGLVVGFNLWEKSLVVRQALEQKGYEDLTANYFEVIKALVSGQFNWFWAVKILGNHLAYILVTSFFWPMLMLIQSTYNCFKKRRLDPILVWVILFVLATLGLSFLHCYHGFIGNPIHYSTYFRYSDQAVMVLIFYGLLDLRKLISGKQKIDRFSMLLWLSLCALILIFLPTRDFYTTINSLGWSWLDLLGQNSLVRSLGLAMIIITSALLLKKRLTYLVLILMIGLQIASWLPIYNLHQSLASSFQSIPRPVKQIAIDKGIKDFFISADFMDKQLLGELYFTKYLLLFYTDKFEPVKIAPTENTFPTRKPYAWLDSPETITQNQNSFSQIVQVNQKLSIGIVE